MDAIEFQYKRIRQKYPDAPELEIWHGVAMDFYLRTGDIPSDVLIRSAFARAETYGVKYRPDQLRVPAGNPDGGQWTDEGGGGGANLRDRVARNRTPADGKPSSSTPSAETSPADAANTPQTYRDDFVPGDQPPIDGAEILPAADRGYNVDLQKEEQGFPDSERGHTLRDHVGKSRSDIEARIKSMQMRALITAVSPIIGTFRGEEEAGRLVNEALARSRDIVEDVIDGVYGKEPKRIFKELNFYTGFEGYVSPLDADMVLFRDTTGVSVVIQQQANKQGFRVITAFPSNKRD